MGIYEPSEDSYLLSDSVKEYLTNLISNNNGFSNVNNKNIHNVKSISSNKHNYTSFTTHLSNSFNHITNIKQISILDMGTGSGIQAKTCKELGFNNLLTSDINKQAVNLLKKQGFKSIHSNLFEKIKQRFDLIIFNPPYLPEDKAEPKDSRLETTAGKQGYELILKFLKQAKSHLNKNGAILLLFSSFSQPSILKKQAKALGYSLKLVNKQNLFFEKIFVYEIKRKK